jgi:hypothetical protein
METNLPELCRRVWAKVPAAIPYDTEDHLSVVVPKRPDEEARWYIPGRTHAIPDDIAESMIQAAALRWLLANVDNTLNSDIITPSGYAFWVKKSVRYWEEQPNAWMVEHTDLTTCLLLAVERCHEYKESKE